MKSTKITAVFGTRPEAIKMCPLILELKKRAGVEMRTALSGQHRELCRDVLDFFSVAPDFDLDIMSHGQTLFDVTDKIFSGIYKELSENTPDILLVHGDTTTAFTSALAAFYLGIKIGHVEAGLRSDDPYSPYPEEFNRRAIDAMSFCHFCPTEHARSRLLVEGIPPERIFVTGNTVVDTLGYTLKEKAPRRKSNEILLLMTLHRRESRGEEMRAVLRAVRRAVLKYENLRVIFPAHPAKEVRDAIKAEIYGAPNVKIVEPLPLPEFHGLIASSDLILSDSGGVQEEAVSLGKPLLLARETTERPEGISSGGIIPVGTDEEKVFSALCRLIASPEEREKAGCAKKTFGDGRASERIADILLSLFS